MRSHASHNGDNGMGAAWCGNMRSKSHAHTPASARVGAKLDARKWAIVTLGRRVHLLLCRSNVGALIGSRRGPGAGTALIKIFPAAAPCPSAAVADLWLPFGALWFCLDWPRTAHKSCCTRVISKCTFWPLELMSVWKWQGISEILWLPQIRGVRSDICNKCSTRRNSRSLQNNK